MESTVLIVVYVFIIGSFVFDMWLSSLNYRNRNQPIPLEVQDVYDKDEYRKWHEYNMETFKFSMIVKSINVVVFLLMLVFGVFVWFHTVSESIFTNARLQVLFFMLLYLLVSRIIGMGISYYRTFVIEEKYGFNKTTKKTFYLDKLKGFMLMVVFGGGLVFLLLVLNDHFSNLFFVYTWLALVVIFLLVNISYVKIIVPLFNTLTPLEDGELKEALFDLAKSVGYEVSKISVMDASRRSTRLNAYFSGFGRFKNIVLYDTLIEKMSTAEIVAVLAHEIGHNKHKHIWYNMAITFLTLFVYIGVFVLVLRNEVFSTAFGFDAVNFGFSIILFTVLLEPISILLNLGTSTVSRTFEYQADRFAATHASKDGIESALKVLSRENFSNLTPHPLYVKLLYSHPPTAQRVRAIRKVETP
jgi:STE24 endopeptidase